ncbi:MAG: hypothetical protein EOO41_02740 [Methanobacteriota archaeon]|nr:MAG: hypothetical protein EOO41_02740 [Euryarchaeota archaeon]
MDELTPGARVDSTRSALDEDVDADDWQPDADMLKVLGMTLAQWQAMNAADVPTSSTAHELDTPDTNPRASRAETDSGSGVGVPARVEAWQHWHAIAAGDARTWLQTAAGEQCHGAPPASRAWSEVHAYASHGASTAAGDSTSRGDAVVKGAPFFVPLTDVDGGTSVSHEPVYFCAAAFIVDCVAQYHLILMAAEAWTHELQQHVAVVATLEDAPLSTAPRPPATDESARPAPPLDLAAATVSDTEAMTPGVLIADASYRRVLQRAVQTTSTRVHAGLTLPSSGASAAVNALDSESKEDATIVASAVHAYLSLAEATATTRMNSAAPALPLDSSGLHGSAQLHDALAQCCTQALLQAIASAEWRYVRHVTVCDVPADALVCRRLEGVVNGVGVHHTGLDLHTAVAAHASEALPCVVRFGSSMALTDSAVTASPSALVPLLTATRAACREHGATVVAFPHSYIHNAMLLDARAHREVPLPSFHSAPARAAE